MAETYYIDPVSGNDENDGKSIPNAWQTIGKANTTLIAGDTVYIMAGTFDEGISPSNSGSSGNLITYSRYSTDVVTIQRTTYSNSEHNKDYIKYYELKFNGANITGGNYCMQLSGDYNEVDDCDFDNVPTGVGIMLYGANYTHVHDCWIDNIGDLAGAGNGIQIEGNYNLIEDNEIDRCGHEGISIDGQFNIVQNNDLHNHVRRNIGMRGTDVNVLQGNIIRDAGELDDSGMPNSGQETSQPDVIIRRNLYYNNEGWGMHFYTDPGGNGVPSGAKFYHNVLYNNGTEGASYPVTGEGICITDSFEASGLADLVIKNNINYDNYDPGIKYRDYASVDDLILANNHWDADGDPKFINPTSNFQLNSDSPCINNGGWLTTITSSTGSGTSFVVADAGYFCDGFGIIAGDEIQLQGKSSNVTITDINYGTNTITVDESVNWTQGDGVALAYKGSAPDQGAYEKQRTRSKFFFIKG